MTKTIILCAIAAAAATSASAQNAAAPAQGPQPVSRTAYLQRVDSSFVTVDGNKDGFMDRGEIEAAESKALNARKAAIIREREALFRALDANKDGNLTMTEFNAKLVAAPIKPNAAPVLDRLDTNKDGKVSLAENRVPAMTQFDRADTNKDGTLSAAEQKARVKR